MGWLGEALGEREPDAPSPRRVKDLIEEELFARRRDLFSALDLVFFDTTSLFFTGNGGDTLGQYAKSKDHRSDCKQMVLGMVIDGDGIPVCSEMWPGNTTDVTTLDQVAARLQSRFGVRRVSTPFTNGPGASEFLNIWNTDAVSRHAAVGPPSVRVATSTGEISIERRLSFPAAHCQRGGRHDTCTCTARKHWHTPSGLRYATCIGYSYSHPRRCCMYVTKFSQSIPTPVYSALQRKAQELGRETHEHIQRVLTQHVIDQQTIATDDAERLKLTWHVVDQCVETAKRICRDGGFSEHITLEAIQHCTRDPSWLEDYARCIEDDVYKHGNPLKGPINRAIGAQIRAGIGRGGQEGFQWQAGHEESARRGHSELHVVRRLRPRGRPRSRCLRLDTRWATDRPRVTRGLQGESTR